MNLNVNIDDSLKEVVERYNTYHGAKTDYVERLVQMSAKFESLDEMEAALESETVDSDGLVLQESINYSGLELGHGIPLSMHDENWNEVVGTDQSSRLPVLEALVLDEGPYVDDGDIERIINEAFNFPAPQTVKKYRRMLVSKSDDIFAMPGSDPRIVEPSGDFGVEYVGVDSDTYTADDIGSESKRRKAKQHWSKHISQVWNDVGSGYVTDRELWEIEVTELMVSICQSITQLDNTKNRRGNVNKVDGSKRALELLYRRLVDVSPFSRQDCWIALGEAKSGDFINFRSTITDSDEVEESVDMDTEKAADVLCVDESATDEEVYVAYRTLVKETHPDVGGSSDEFKRVETAKEVLVG